MTLPDFDDKDLGILALLIIAAVSVIVCGKEAFDLIENVVIAIGSLVTGVKYQKAKEE